MKRGAVVASIALAAVLAAAGAGVAWWALTRSPGPDVVAHDFLSALADGDGSRAVALIDDLPDSAVRAAESLEAAAALVTEPQIESIGSVEGSTRVRVTFALAGEQRTASFGLVERDGAWRISADALGTVTPTTTLGDSVGIGDILLSAETATSLLPGAYEVSAAPTGLLAGATPVAVLPGADAPVAVAASLSPDATAQAQAQLDAYAASCAAPAAAVPEHCGIRVPWAADLAALASIAFRVEASPVVALSPDGRTFAATGGIIVATATGATRDGRTASFTYRADDWGLRGSVSFTRDEMVLHVG